MTRLFASGRLAGEVALERRVRTTFGRDANNGAANDQDLRDLYKIGKIWELVLVNCVNREVRRGAFVLRNL